LVLVELQQVKTVGQAGFRQALFCKPMVLHLELVVEGVERLATAVGQAVMVAVKLVAVAARVAIQVLVEVAVKVATIATQPILLLVQGAQAAAEAAAVAHLAQAVAAELAY
jgi:hypothetical protein